MFSWHLEFIHLSIHSNIHSMKNILSDYDMPDNTESSENLSETKTDMVHILLKNIFYWGKEEDYN